MTDDINNLGSEVSKLTGVIQGFEQVASSLIGMFTNIGSKGVAAFKGVGEAATTSFSSLTSGAQAAGATVDSASEAGSKLMDIMLGVNSVFANHDTFNLFAANAKNQFLSIGDASQALGNNIGLIGKALDAVSGSHISGVLADLVKMGTAGQQAEAGFYAMVSSSSQLNEVWGKGAMNISNLDVNTTTYVNKLQLLAVENKTTIDRTLELANAMSKISPDSMDSIVKVGEGAGSTMSTLTAIMRVAAGAGRDQTDVTNAISSAYANLGNAQNANIETDQRGINLFSAMVDLQQHLKVRFEDSKKALEDVASEFRNVGDETDSAAKIFDTFGNALRNTGITAHASMEIVGTMIKGISELTVGTKAFLSSQSGGPGGLQGSLQIDEMLRKNDLAGVMNIAQNALKSKFGGNIVTQQEGAEQGGNVAYQYQKERSMLQSGAFGIGKGVDDQTAGRIIEAMKQGNVSGFADTMKSGQTTAGDLATKGNAIQERNASELTRMAQILQRNTIAAEITAASTMRKTLGSEASPEALDNLHKYYDRATAELQEKEHPVSGMGKEQHAPGDLSTSLEHLRGRNIEDTKSSIIGMLEGIKKAIVSQITPTQETASPILSINPVSEDHKTNIQNHALKTPHTAAMDKQAQATKEAVSKTHDKDQTVKVIIEVNDKGKNVDHVSVIHTPSKQNSNNAVNDVPQPPFTPGAGR